MEIILGALAEAIFGILIEDLAQRPGLTGLRERLRGASPEKLALQRALTVAYVAFSHEYSSLATAFFDDYFLQKPQIATELAKFLTPNQVPDGDTIEQVWRAQFHDEPKVDLRRPIAYFLETYENEVKAQPILKPFTDSRAFDQLYIIAQRNQEQVVLQEQIRDLLVDIRSLLSGTLRQNSYFLSQTVINNSIDQSHIQENLINLLLEVPAFQEQESRNMLLFGLDNLAPAIPRSNVLVTDIIAIVNVIGSVGRLTTGRWPLGVLVQNAQRFCPPNTDLGRQLSALLFQLESDPGGYR